MYNDELFHFYAGGTPEVWTSIAYILVPTMRRAQQHDLWCSRHGDEQ